MPAPRRTSPSGADDGFGARLRARREAAGLTQTALAGTGLHPSYVSQLESGRRRPTERVVRILAARLGCDVDELMRPGAARPGTELALAEAALGLGRPDEALALLDPWSEAVRDTHRLASDPLLRRTARGVATSLERLGRMEEAIEVLEAVRAADDAAPGEGPRFATLVALVRCYRDVGDLSRAIDVGETAMRAVADSPEPRATGHAALLSTLASAYSERGDLVRSAALLDQALDRTGPDAPPLDRASLYWNAAITAVERGRTDEGLALSEQAAVLVALAHDLRAEARLPVTRAWVLLAQSPPDAEAARSLLREALPAIRQHDTPYTLASAETELSRCELLLGRPEVARKHAASALRRLGTGTRVERSRALAALGAAELACGDTVAGLAALDEGASGLEEVGAHRQAAPVWRELAEVLAAAGRPAEALAAARRALDAAGVPAPAVAGERAAARRSGVRR